jgi:hypothetical protein
MATMPQLQHKRYGEMGVWCSKDKVYVVTKDHHLVTFWQAFGFILGQINHKMQLRTGQRGCPDQPHPPCLDHANDCCGAAKMRLAVMQKDLGLVIRDQHCAKPDHLQCKARFASP